MSDEVKKETTANTFYKKEIHPFRYKTSRKYIPAFLSTYRQSVGLNDISPSHLRIFQPKFIDVYNKEIAKVKDKELLDPPAAAVNHELSMFLHYARFHAAGQNIFRPTPYLVELLKHTDVSDIVLSEIKFPFSAFYLSFGNNQKWYLGSESNIIDGAYIKHLSGEKAGLNWRAFEIVLTSYNLDSISVGKSFVHNPNVYYYFIFRYEADEKKTLKELLEESLAEEFKDLSDKAVDLSALDTLEEDEDTSFIKNSVIDTEDYSPFKINTVRFENDNSITVSKTEKVGSEFIRRKFLRENLDTFLATLKLIVNLICYISSEPDDQQEKYPIDAPPNKVEQFENTDKPAAKRRIEQQLLNDGYSRIKIVGKKFDNEFQSIRRNFEGTPGEMPAHWRRGHWRSQAYGSGMSERRLIFIKPVLVRADKGLPEKGHVYSIGENKPVVDT